MIILKKIKPSFYPHKPENNTIHNQKENNQPQEFLGCCCSLKVQDWQISLQDYVVKGYTKWKAILILGHFHLAEHLFMMTGNTHILVMSCFHIFHNTSHPKWDSVYADCTVKMYTISYFPL